jgi:hypothetical protein
MGRELAVARIAPVTALEAIASRGGWRSRQAHGEQTDCEEAGGEKTAHGANSSGFIFNEQRRKTSPRANRSLLPSTAGHGSWLNLGFLPELYPALTTLAHHHVMKTRDNMSAVIRDLQRDHGLLAAYLEATDRIDWRALHKRVAIPETPEPINVEAHQASSVPELPDVVPSTPQFTFRRANLVRTP